MLKPKFQKHIYPDSVIYMRGDDDFIRERAKGLCKESECKWDRENLERRLTKFHESNDLSLFVSANTDPDMGLPSAKVHKLPITRFYQENKTEVFEIDCDGLVFEMFESMRVYIERHGRPFNYLSSVRNLNQKREEHLSHEESDALQD